MNEIQVIDYDAGNLRSVVSALGRLGVQGRIVKSAQELDARAPVILPGVGAAGRAMESLAKTGLAERIPACTAPVLGICLGMQLMAESSEEDDVQTLGIFPGRVRRIQTIRKLPHMGWNAVRWRAAAALLATVPMPSDLYFAHSYCVNTDPEYVVASCDYGHEIPVIIHRRNFWGIQCHPEKSGPAGMKILENFVKEARS